MRDKTNPQYQTTTSPPSNPPTLMTGDLVLPTDPAERKGVPIASGVIDYFPAAIAEIARVSKAGNDQHNPGEPLHWARGKSMDQADTIMRHFLDRGTRDKDGLRHSAKLAWRALALLQLECEADGAPVARGAKVDDSVPVFAALTEEEDAAWTELTHKLDADNAPTTAPEMINVSGVPYPVPNVYDFCGKAVSFPVDLMVDNVLHTEDCTVNLIKCELGVVDSGFRFSEPAHQLDEPDGPVSDWADYYQTARNNLLALNDLLINGKNEKARAALRQATSCLIKLSTMADTGNIVIYGKPVVFA